MDVFPLIFAATTQSEINWLPLFVDLGTIAAGFAAAATLGIDIYTRTLERKPLLTAFVDSTKDNDNLLFFLTIQNLGYIPAVLINIKTEPDWSNFDGITYATPLTFFQGHILQPNQSIKIPMDTSVLIDTLHAYHENTPSPNTPYTFNVTLTYKSQTRFHFTHSKTEVFPINLTSNLISQLPLSSIITNEDDFQIYKDIYDLFSTL